LSVRLKLTLSYAGFLMVAGAVLLVAGYFSLSRGFHPGVTFMVRRHSDLVHSFAPTAALVMLFLLLFGLGGGWLLAGRMLAPLPRITDATRKAATGTLSHRIELEGPNDEFRELADAFDGMLARLEAHVGEQQRFAANASHELRTPLAVTKTLLDVAARNPDRDARAVLHRLEVVNTRAIDLTEALLLLSRAGQGGLDAEPVDLSLVAEEAAETLLPLATKRGVTIDTSGDVAHTSGSAALLLQMATNLVHNAIVHNLPMHGSVCISTHARPTGVLLTVENTGQALDPALVSTLAEPFRRGTERIQDDDSGVGLGLAIVERIVRAHGGTLALRARPGGGLLVSVHLPPVPPATSGTGRATRASYAVTGVSLRPVPD
jgi:two-component system sensor histidine kinase VanS